MTQLLIDHVGWRWTFVATGCLLLFVLVPANALLQRRSPDDVGQFPDGDNALLDSGPHGRHGHKLGARDWTLGEAVASFPFWCVTIGHLALGTALFMINTHAIAHFVAVGVDKLTASFYFGLMGFIRIGATVVWGTLSDRLGRDKAYGIATAVTASGVACLVALTSGASLWLIYLAVALYGIGHSAGNPTYGAVIGDVFSGRKIGVIFGFLEISFGFGSALGSWLGGYLFDVTGSYAWPFSVCFACFIVSGFAIHACSRWQERRSTPMSATQ
jgi:MFS family permease